MMEPKQEVSSDPNTTMPPGSAGPAAKWTVDSIQGPHALVTDGQNQVTLPLEMLPKGIQPGDPLDDEIGSVLTNDPSGDKNMAEQEPNTNDTMDMGDKGAKSRARMAGYDDDQDDAGPVKIKPTQSMTRLR